MALRAGVHRRAVCLVAAAALLLAMLRLVRVVLPQLGRRLLQVFAREIVAGLVQAELVAALQSACLDQLVDVALLERVVVCLLYTSRCV